MMYEFANIYNTHYARTVPFCDLEPLLDSDVLINAAKAENFSFKKLESRINFKGIEQYDFWQKLLQMRSLLPRNVLFDLWYSAVIDRNSANYHQIYLNRSGAVQNDAEPLLPEKYRQNVKRNQNIRLLKKKLNENDKKLLRSSSLTEELLIDNPSVRNRICQLKGKGFELLRYTVSRRTVTLKLPAKMRQAIENDNAGAFLICKDISGVKFSYSLIAEIIQKRAYRIFDEILKNYSIFKKAIPLDELAVCLTVQFEDSASMPFLKSLESAYPGTLKNFRDPWGRNLLWYTVYNQNTAFFHPFCKLTELLLQSGCDPDNLNQLGFSWRYMMKNLDFKKKSKMMERRYSKSKITNPVPLFIEQPFYALADKSYESEWMKNFALC